MSRTGAESMTFFSFCFHFVFSSHLVITEVNHDDMKFRGKWFWISNFLSQSWENLRDKLKNFSSSTKVVQCHWKLFRIQIQLFVHSWRHKMKSIFDETNVNMQKQKTKNKLQDISCPFCKLIQLSQNCSRIAIRGHYTHFSNIIIVENLKSR